MTGSTRTKRSVPAAAHARGDDDARRQREHCQSGFFCRVGKYCEENKHDHHSLLLIGQSLVAGAPLSRTVRRDGDNAKTAAVRQRYCGREEIMNGKSRKVKKRRKKGTLPGGFVYSRAGGGTLHVHSALAACAASLEEQTSWTNTWGRGGGGGIN